MKAKILIILFCCSCSVCFAQETIKQDSIKNKRNIVQHNLFIELFGSSMLVYNITYDCSFALTEKHKIAIAAGVGFFPSLLTMDLIYGGSLQLNYLYLLGEKNHYFEIGTGITFAEFFHERGVESAEWRRDPYWVVPVRIGYRYQSSDGGFFWKIATVPLFGQRLPLEIGSRLTFIPVPGVAMGYTFKNKKHYKKEGENTLTLRD